MRSAVRAILSGFALLSFVLLFLKPAQSETAPFNQVQEQKSSPESAPIQEKKEIQPEQKSSSASPVTPSASKTSAPRWGEQKKPVRSDPPDTLSGTPTLALFTLLVVGLILVFFVVIRRLSRSKLFASGGVMQIMARKTLSPKQVIYLVEVGPKVYLLGTTRDHLVTLGVFSKKEDVAVLRAMCLTKSEQSMERTFNQTLNESLNDWSSETKGSDRVNTLLSELTEIKSKVKGWNA